MKKLKWQHDRKLFKTEIWVVEFIDGCPFTVSIAKFKKIENRPESMMYIHFAEKDLYIKKNSRNLKELLQFAQGTYQKLCDGELP